MKNLYNHFNYNKKKLYKSHKVKSWALKGSLIMIKLILWNNSSFLYNNYNLTTLVIMEKELKFLIFKNNNNSYKKWFINKLYKNNNIV